MRKTKTAEKEVAPQPKRRAPATSLEARENQLISLAYDVAEKQMRDGTATSQILTEFLKRGSTRDRLEKEIMEKNKELLTAKTDAIKAEKNKEELYERALSAMRMYTGNAVQEDYDD